MHSMSPFTVFRQRLREVCTVCTVLHTRQRGSGAGSTSGPGRRRARSWALTSFSLRDAVPKDGKHKSARQSSRYPRGGGPRPPPSYRSSATCRSLIVGDLCCSQFVRSCSCLPWLVDLNIDRNFRFHFGAPWFPQCRLIDGDQKFWAQNFGSH